MNERLGGGESRRQRQCCVLLTSPSDEEDALSGQRDSPEIAIPISPLRIMHPLFSCNKAPCDENSSERNASQVVTCICYLQAGRPVGGKQKRIVMKKRPSLFKVSVHVALQKRIKNSLKTKTKAKLLVPLSNQDLPAPKETKREKHARAAQTRRRNTKGNLGDYTRM